MKRGLTVNKSACLRKDLLEPANRHRRDSTSAAMAHARVTREDNRISTADLETQGSAQQDRRLFVLVEAGDRVPQNKARRRQGWFRWGGLRRGSKVILPAVKRGLNVGEPSAMHGRSAHQLGRPTCLKTCHGRIVGDHRVVKA